MALMQLVAYGNHNQLISNYDKNKPIPKEELIFRHIEDDDKNTECPISFEIIKYGDKYYKCKCCKHNFDDNSIKHITDKNMCPVCRTYMWHDNKIYINMYKPE